MNGARIWLNIISMQAIDLYQSHLARLSLAARTPLSHPKAPCTSLASLPRESRRISFQRLAAALQARLMAGTCDGAKALPAAGFVVDRLHVWLTPADDRSLKSWKLVKQVQLGA